MLNVKRLLKNILLQDGGVVYALVGSAIAIQNMSSNIGIKGIFITLNNAII